MQYTNATDASPKHWPRYAQRRALKIKTGGYRNLDWQRHRIVSHLSPYAPAFILPKQYSRNRGSGGGVKNRFLNFDCT